METVNVPFSVTKKSKIREVVSAENIQSKVNEYLVRKAGTGFVAGEPEMINSLEGILWRVPIFLAYPKKGVVGRVGDFFLDAHTGGIISLPPEENLKTKAKRLLE
ncbi:MAG TPA: hypothetical protein ENG12_04110 [Candidatus Altiarchaeales archaeon]|nr:hypothetical protein [Candidatus Altiarchaeales archaeon]